MSSNHFTAVYQPGDHTYNYMSDIQDFVLSDTYKAQIKMLKSRGYDADYPAQYCNTVVFGGVEIALDSTITYSQQSIISNAFTSEQVKSAELNLALPVMLMMNGCSRIINDMPFGQPEGSSYVSKVTIEYPLNGGTVFKWYKNNEVVATDTLVNVANGFITLAVVYSGTTILQYAYIYNHNNETWTSGAKSDSAVLDILNDGGTGGVNESRYGWADTENGEFIISKIYDHDGYEATSGWVAGGSWGETPASAYTDLQNKCAVYGGYLGTDIVQYITGADSNAEGWMVLNNPASDGLTMDIPSTEGHALKVVWTYSNSTFHFYDGETELYTITPQYRNSGMSYVYMTYYKQNSSPENATQFPIVYLINAGGYPQYQMETVNVGDNITLEEFDNEENVENEIEGYDPSSGQEDDPQDDPEDTEDPANDPLATGFLYAFMVGSNDMLHLADALVPDTLSQKIKADFGNNLFDFIVSYHMMPCLTNGDSANKIDIAYRGTPFLYGENNTQLQLAPITKTWYQVSCGTRMCLPKTTSDKPVRFNGFENWANANVQLYLPFIGMVHLNTADVWNKAITIVYIFDILNGTCVANIGVGNQGTMYSYEGTCKYTIPFTSLIDQSNQNLISGIVSSVGSAVTIGGAIATGSPAGVIRGITNGAGAVGNFLSAIEHKSLINRGGALSGSAGWNMPRKPCLYITIPNIYEAKNQYNMMNGYPCYVPDAFLSSYQNEYVEVGQIELKAYANKDGALPNDTELDMIKSLLKDGVYI